MTPAAGLGRAPSLDVGSPQRLTLDFRRPTSVLARRRINSGTHGEALLRTRRIGAVRATLRQELRIPQGFLRVLSFVKLNTLEKVYLCLRDLTPEITLSDELSQQALLRIERMMAIG